MESKSKKVVKPSIFAQKSNTISAKEADSKKKQLKIAERFILKSCIGTGTFFKAYRAIDMSSRKFVTVYIKPVTIKWHSFPSRRFFPRILKKNWSRKYSHLSFIPTPTKLTKTLSISKCMPSSALHLNRFHTFTKRRFLKALSSFWLII